MKISRILLFTGGLMVAISVTAFLHDRLTYTPGMISWREDIQKWREVTLSRSDRITRSALFGCVFAGLPIVIWGRMVRIA